MASLIPGISMYAFFSLVPILTLAYTQINRQSLWNYLAPHNCYVATAQDKLYACGVCEAMVGETLLDQHTQCPRCASPMHKRIPNSLQKTTALLVASTILYIPANLLPFMTTRTLTGDRDDTLVSGVISLMKHDMWLIALVVFLASIVVPMAKLGVLIYLLASAHWQHYRNQTTKIRLYHLTEFIGRWSMVDVYVVTLLTALVQFGFLGNVQPGNALVAFAAVVVLTMLAAESFDPRLLDAPQEQPGEFPAQAFK
jgi:paraquat-inducible protein A